MALKLDVLANTRQLVSEMKKAGATTEDVTDALDDMAKDGVKAGDKLERSFRDLAREADTSGDKIGRGFDAGFDKAKRGADEFGREANSTAKESAASFDGSADSIVDAFQEISANAFAGFGPAGAVAGLAIAAGIGVGMSALENLGVQSEQLSENVKQNFRDMASEGVKAWEGVAAESQRLTDAYADHEGEIKRIAELIGIPFETVAAAWAGNKDAIDLVNQGYNDMTRDLRTTLGVSVEAADATIKGWEGIKKPLDDTVKGYDLAREKAKMLEGQVAQSEQASRAEIEKTRKQLEAVTRGEYRPVIRPRLDTSEWDRWVPNPKTGRVNARATGGVTWE